MALRAETATWVRGDAGIAEFDFLFGSVPGVFGWLEFTVFLPNS